jgi:MerR family transcriptional regulator, heat shock protein HspR
MEHKARRQPSALGDSDYPGYAMGAAADVLGVTPAFLRSAEAAGLFEAHRSGGGHRRYTRDDLERADRARQLVDDGLPMEAAVRIVSLEYRLTAAQEEIKLLRRKQSQRDTQTPNPNELRENNDDGHSPTSDLTRRGRPRRRDGDRRA